MLHASMIDELARDQHGAVARRHLLAAGLTSHQISKLVLDGRLIRRHSSVYVTAGSARTRRQDLWAASLVTDPPAAVSHRAAVEEFGSSVDGSEHIELSTMRERRPRLDGVMFHRSRDLHPSQVIDVDGLIVTSPTRTLVDLGQVAPWWIVERALEEFLVRGHVTIEGVRAARLLHGRQGRRGVGTLAKVLELRSLGEATPDSVLESAMARVLASSALPQPEFQYPLIAGGQRFILDFAYPALRIALEVDGYEFHSGRKQTERDIGRDLALGNAGWRVLHFTWNMVIYRSSFVGSSVASAIFRREQENW